MNRYNLYIGGKWIPGHSGSFIEIENPSTEQIFAQVPRGDETDVERAIAAAKSAFPAWSAWSPAKRADLMDGLADYLESHAQEIAETVTAELGVPRKIVRSWHIDSPIAEARFFAKTARNFHYEQKLPGVLIRREPIGVVAALTPWNFPLDQVSVKIFPALAAGNCVVLKPSRMAPLSAYHIVKAAEAVGFPPGVLNLVTGKGSEVGNVLACHPDVDMVSFTGSTKVGITVGRLALGTVKKVALELGGKSASVLLPGGNMKLAAEATLSKCFLNSGQTCSALTRFIIPRSYKNRMESIMTEITNRLKVGDPLDFETDIGPVVSKAAFEKVKRYIESGIADGARLLVGSVPESRKKGYYIHPVIFTDVQNKMEIARDEIFGPVLCVFYYDDPREALALANDSPYGLSGAVFGKEEEAQKFAAKMRTGVIHLNGAPFTVEAPFGGYKQSGIGRENSVYSFDEYLEIKSVLKK